MCRRRRARTHNNNNNALQQVKIKIKRGREREPDTRQKEWQPRSGKRSVWHEGEEGGQRGPFLPVEKGSLTTCTYLPVYLPPSTSHSPSSLLTPFYYHYHHPVALASWGSMSTCLQCISLPAIHTPGSRTDINIRQDRHCLYGTWKQRLLFLLQ